MPGELNAQQLRKLFRVFVVRILNLVAAMNGTSVALATVTVTVRVS